MFNDTKRDTAVVILAAGQGTRMKSRMAKVLHRAGGKPLVRQAIDTAMEIAPPERIFVVVGYQADRVRAEVQAAGARAIHQTEQLGTGHAVMCGEAELAGSGGRVIVFVGDCPLIRAATLAELAEMQGSSGSAATVITTELDDPTGYGRIIRDAGGGVDAIVEQKAATPEQLAVREINSGIFCFDSAALWKHIHEIRPDNPAREYYLTDMVSILKRAGKQVTALKVPEASELLGVNNRIELAAADRILRERKLRQLMLDGVTIEQPETVTVDSACEGRDGHRNRGILSDYGRHCDWRKLPRWSVDDYRQLRAGRWRRGVSVLDRRFVESRGASAGGTLRPFATWGRISKKARMWGTSSS